MAAGKSGEFLEAVHLRLDSTTREVTASVCFLATLVSTEAFTGTVVVGKILDSTTAECCGEMLGLLGPPSLLSFWIRRLDSTKADEPEGGDLVNSGTSGGGIDSETGGFVGTTATSWTLVAFGAGEFVGMVF